MEQFDVIFNGERSQKSREELKKMKGFVGLCVLLVRYHTTVFEFSPQNGDETLDTPRFTPDNLVEFHPISRELMTISNKDISQITLGLIHEVQHLFLDSFTVGKSEMQLVFDGINKQYIENTRILCAEMEKFFLQHHHAESENNQETLTKEHETDDGYLLFNEYEGKRKALLKALKSCKWFHYFHQPNSLFDHSEVRKIINCKKEYIEFLALLFHELAQENYIKASNGKGYMRCFCKYILCEGKEVKTQYMHNLVGKIQNDPKRHERCIRKVKQIIDSLKSINESKT